jgi:hypothetical protein
LIWRVASVHVELVDAGDTNPLATVNTAMRFINVPFRSESKSQDD